MSGLPAYAELHCLSNFSFLRGASRPEELVQRAHQLGYSALAITDECSVAGVVRAHVRAKELEFPLIIGAEFGFERKDGEALKLVLLATDRASYARLSALITLGRRRSEKGRYRLDLSDLDEGLLGCLALWVPGREPQEKEARWLADRFSDRAWIALELHRGPDDRAHTSRLLEIARHAQLPLVAAGDVHMHLRSRRRLQDTMSAIRLRKPVRECGHALFPNAERHLRLRARLAQLYPPALLRETVAIAERCDFSLAELRYEYPQELVPDGHSAASWLRELTEKGLRSRYKGDAPEKVRDQIEQELALIARLKYESFFLTVEDLVRYARSKEILCQGRGSAANSAVCYALRITEVDPSTGNLLFARFLSEERDEPPDIDVDFEHQRREEVIQYLYEKYGRERAAIAASVICYRPKSALRDVGKALGLDADEVDRIGAALAWWDDRHSMPQRLLEAGFDPHSTLIRNLLELADQLLGFPRHLSQHVGGFVISQGPLDQLVPIENAAMEDRSVIQWDKDDLESLGLLKIDVLALGMLSAIRRALQLVGDFRGRPLSMEEVQRTGDDPAVYQMIQRADTIGVFQIESRAQMSMLPRLKPKVFYDLVIQVAIVRPGPIQGGMVHPYLQRREHPERVEYEKPELEPVLKRTLGVPIFQEQVMQLAIVAAGFSAGEADQLRRAMAAWRRTGDLTKFQHKLLEGLKENGYSADFADRLYRQICGFGEYGFPESHAASFALLAYVSSWIKLYHPAAFCAALLNSQPMGFYAPAQLVQDARRHDVEFLPVDAMASEWECTLERGEKGEPALRLGFLMVKGLPQASARRIVAARSLQAFASEQDVAHRAALNVKELKALAAAGAFRALSPHRRKAYWEVLGIETGVHLMQGAAVAESAAQLAAPTEGEDLVADYRSLGLTLGRHPLTLLRAKLERLGVSCAERIQAMEHGARACAAGIVTGRQRPDTASGVVFVTLEDETGYVNVVVWRRITDRQRKELLGARLMRVEGVVERSGDVVHLVARRLIDDSALLGRLTTQSRDFH